LTVLPNTCHRPLWNTTEKSLMEYAFRESCFGPASTSLELQRKLLGRPGAGDGEVLGEVVPPVQGVPLMAKFAGTGLLWLFQTPLRPNETLPPVPTVPFQPALRASTCGPAEGNTAFALS
jgi:hypothetical protein